MPDEGGAGMTDDRQPGGSGAGSTVIWCTRFEEPVSTGFEHHHDPCSASDHVVYVPRAALEAAQGENERLRQRNHEIQEAADKRWSAGTREWRRWQQTLEIADQLYRDNCGDIGHSAIARAVLTRTLLERDQSRATEAELRRQRDGYFAALNSIAASYCESGRATYHSHIAKDALDAAEQPAPPKTAPRVRSANASVSDDRPDLETTEGPL
jgi:hypothetical protein